MAGEWSSGPCRTSHDAENVACSCAKTGLVAVVGRHVVPAVGVDLSYGTSAAGGVYARSMQWPLAATLLYVMCVTSAARADRRGVLYGVQPPWWLWPGWHGYTVWRQILVNARINHELLRWRYVFPGHTENTHAQLVHALLTYMLLTACGVLLFLGVEQCTQAQTLIASATSSCCASIAVLIGRKALNIGLNQGARKRALDQNTADRELSFMAQLALKPALGKSKSLPQVAEKSEGKQPMLRPPAWLGQGVTATSARWTSSRFSSLRSLLIRSSRSSSISEIKPPAAIDQRKSRAPVSLGSRSSDEICGGPSEPSSACEMGSGKQTCSGRCSAPTSKQVQTRARTPLSVDPAHLSAAFPRLSACAHRWSSTSRSGCASSSPTRAAGAPRAGACRAGCARSRHGGAAARAASWAWRSRQGATRTRASGGAASRRRRRASAA